MAELPDIDKETRDRFYRQADELEQQDEGEEPLLWRVTWWRKRADEAQDLPPVDDD